jgi:hypothetical protein
MDQSKAGSDCCEHHFGNLNDKNQNGCLQDSCKARTAKSTAHRAHTFSKRAKTNMSGSELRVTELIAPLAQA